MATVLITGGTGLIGTALSKALVEKGHQLIILTRKGEDKKKNEAGISYAYWDINKQEIDSAAAFGGTDFIVHLAGANVAEKRWTEKRKQEIVDSRVKSGELLVKSLRTTENKVQAVICASAIGWYGPDPSIPNPSPFREDAPAANDFLGSTCLKWEESLRPMESLGKRVVWIRTGIVLSKEGGALEEFRKPLKFGIASILSKGRQIMSWIHLDDLLRIYVEAITNATMHGAYNAVAPTPVSNEELVLQLAKEKKGKFFIPIHVPAFVLKAMLGEMSVEVLKSATVSCSRLHVQGFVFLYPSVEAAMKQV